MPSYHSYRLWPCLRGIAAAVGLSCLLLFACFQASAHAPLQLNEDEIAWRRSHPILRVGVFAGDHMPLEAWMGGQPEGLGVDYVRLLAARAGLQLAFHPYTDWDAMASASATQPLPFDLLLALPDARGNDSRLRLLHPFLQAAPIMVTRRNDTRTRDQRDLARARIIIERRFKNTIERLGQHYPDAVLLYCDTGPQCLDSVARGEADAYIGITGARTRALLASRRTNDLTQIGSAGLPMMAFAPAIRADATPLASLLDKAAATIDTSELDRIRHRWGFDDDNADYQTSQIRLSPEESKQLRSLPILRVGFEVDRYPYSFIDGGGRFDGMAADYLAHISEQLGLRIQPVPARDWSHLQKMIHAGEIDLVAAGTPGDFHHNEIAFSRAYEYFPEVIVVSTHGPAIASARDLDGRTVAVRDEAGLISRLQSQLSRTTFLPVGSNEAGLAMVAEHAADAYVGTLPAIDSLIRDRYAANLRVVGPVGLDQELAFGARGEFQALLPLFDRILANMAPPEKRAIRARWLTSTYRYGVPWDWVIGGTIAAVLIIAIVVLAYLRLHRLSQARERAERALGTQLAFQRALLESIPYPIFVKDARDHYLAVNHAYETMFNCQREALLGHRLAEANLNADVDLAGMLTADNALPACEATGHYELQLPPRDPSGPPRNAILWSHQFPYDADDLPGRLATLVDVSEIRAAQARARSSEQRLSDITGAIPATVFQFRTSPQGQGRFIYAAGNVQALLGINAEQLINDEAIIFERVHSEDRPVLMQKLQETAETLQALPAYEFRLWVNNQWRWLRTESGQPRRLADGSVEWSGYWIDVDAAHAQAQALHEAKARAELAASAKASFLASMSHEIRTPMAGVLGLIELLARTSMDHEQAHMLRLADDSAKAMLQILDDILDYSRIESGRLAIANHPFDPRSLVDSIMGLFTARAQEKQIHLRVVQDRSVAGKLHGDAIRIRQVLSNLVSNAIKFTDQGHVILTMTMVEDSSDHQRIRFSVTDTGIGIARDDLEQLFTPFTQVETPDARHFGGTGLGLAISRRIASLMGGDLNLISEPGIGTEAVFELTLPIAEPLTPLPAFNGKRVRLQSDDGPQGEGLFNDLSALGFEVLRERTGGSAHDPSIDLSVIQADAVGDSGCPDDIPCIRIEANGSVESEPCPGCISLPGTPLLHHAVADACLEALGQRESHVSPSSGLTTPQHNGHVLVAEDHPVNRALIARQLDRLGYAYTVVENGERALSILADGHVDLLLTDCHMPDPDGFSLARKIRSNEQAHEHLPIIALSASALPEQVKRCLDAGMDDFLAKPVQLDQLAEKLAYYLEPPLVQAMPTRASESRQHLTSNASLDVFESMQTTSLMHDLITACVQDLAYLDALPTTALAARRQLLHRMEGALALFVPLPMNALSGTNIESLDVREREIRQHVQALIHSFSNSKESAQSPA